MIFEIAATFALFGGFLLIAQALASMIDHDLDHVADKVGETPILVWFWTGLICCLGGSTVGFIISLLHLTGVLT